MAKAKVLIFWGVLHIIINDTMLVIKPDSNRNPFKILIWWTETNSMCHFIQYNCAYNNPNNTNMFYLLKFSKMLFEFN